MPKTQPKMQAYNHAFTIAFSVSGSAFPFGDACLESERSLVIAELLRRVRELLLLPDEIVEAAECFDTYPEEEPCTTST